MLGRRRELATTCSPQVCWTCIEGGVWASNMLGEEGRDHLLLQVRNGGVRASGTHGLEAASRHHMLMQVCVVAQRVEAGSTDHAISFACQHAPHCFLQKHS